jgi:hypothetical protein
LSSGDDSVRPEAPILETPLAVDPGDVPVLQDAEAPPQPQITEEQLVSMQAELTTLTRDLADRLLDHAMRDMEAALVEQVSNRLREELPALIERVLRENLEPGD